RARSATKSAISSGSDRGITLLLDRRLRRPCCERGVHTRKPRHEVHPGDRMGEDECRSRSRYRPEGRDDNVKLASLARSHLLTPPFMASARWSIMVGDMDAPPRAE